MSLNIFSGARRLADARAQRKASLRYEAMMQPPPREWWDKYRQQAPSAFYCRNHKTSEPIDSPCRKLLKACREAATFLPHDPAEAERIMREALAVTR